jgi:WD40 repeat protein
LYTARFAAVQTIMTQLLQENLIAMDNSVISLAFSRDSQLLATGSTDGIIAVSPFAYTAILTSSW